MNCPLMQQLLTKVYDRLSPTRRLVSVVEATTGTIRVLACRNNSQNTILHNKQQWLKAAQDEIQSLVKNTFALTFFFVDFQHLTARRTVQSFLTM